MELEELAEPNWTTEQADESGADADSDPGWVDAYEL
jgi:hypothetical protein